jgi:hypothetical protein
MLLPLPLPPLPSMPSLPPPPPLLLLVPVSLALLQQAWAPSVGLHVAAACDGPHHWV